MQYFIDTEFDGLGGRLISLALTSLDGRYLYLKYPRFPISDPWAEQNVMPILDDIPEYTKDFSFEVSQRTGAHKILEFLHDNNPFTPTIIADWPDDISYFCRAIITGPGMMINLPSFNTQLVRINAYPTSLEGAVQHNAMWDAIALKEKWIEGGYS